MKRIATVLSVTIFLVVVPGAFASPGLQLALFGSTQFSEKPGNIDDVADQYRNRVADETFGGLSMELVLGRIGLGARYQGLYVDRGESAEDWWMDWKSDGYLTYHLFGGLAFLDPFVSIGSGAAGRIDLQREEGYEGETGLTNLSIYQYVGGGGQVNAGGVVLGAALNYFMVNQGFEDTSEGWAEYPMDRFEIVVYGGVAIGNN